ncbi:peptide deformylase, partial [Anaerofustis stercorihominis]
MIKEILLLGNPNLYKVSKEVKEEEIQLLKNIEIDLHDTLMNYRKVHGAGRAIAAPQIGIEKRILYMNIDKPILIVNPKLTFPDSE